MLYLNERTCLVLWFDLFRCVIYDVFVYLMGVNWLLIQLVLYDFLIAPIHTTSTPELYCLVFTKP